MVSLKHSRAGNSICDSESLQNNQDYKQDKWIWRSAKSPSCTCGNSGKVRIVGGVDAVPGEFPWQVDLVVK